MTTHEPPAELINKVTEQLYLLLSTIEARVAPMPPRSEVEFTAREIVATCNDHKIVADDKLLDRLRRELYPTPDSDAWPEDN